MLLLRDLIRITNDNLQQEDHSRAHLNLIATLLQFSFSQISMLAELCEKHKVNTESVPILSLKSNEWHHPLLQMFAFFYRYEFKDIHY